LEAVVRPALIIDGQHRLIGAHQCSAEQGHDIFLPVVALPSASWVDQVYQFIVINEKAEKVKKELLTDIFGSSLTNEEQRRIRDDLEVARVDVEVRIAAVIANRDSRSPFRGLVRLTLVDAGDDATTVGFITDATIQLLIEKGSRGARAWRSDDDFYEAFVEPTYPDRTKWDSWTDGTWRRYWFAFWTEVADFYNEERTQEDPLWSDELTNLTKGVTLRTLQALFMEKMVGRMRSLETTKEQLKRVLSEEKFEETVETLVSEQALPTSVKDFRRLVREEFLTYIPVRIFEKSWVKSLDDATGQEALATELAQAFDKNKAGKRYHAQNKDVFAVESDD